MPEGKAAYAKSKPTLGRLFGPVVVAGNAGYQNQPGGRALEKREERAGGRRKGKSGGSRVGGR